MDSRNSCGLFDVNAMAAKAFELEPEIANVRQWVRQANAPRWKLTIFEECTRRSAYIQHWLEANGHLPDGAERMWAGAAAL